MTTSSLPHNYVVTDSDTIVVSVSADGITTPALTVTGALTVSGQSTLSSARIINAQMTVLTSALTSALWAGGVTNNWGNMGYFAMVVNGTTVHIPFFQGGTLLPNSGG